MVFLLFEMGLCTSVCVVVVVDAVFFFRFCMVVEGTSTAHNILNTFRCKMLLIKNTCVNTVRSFA